MQNNKIFILLPDGIGLRNFAFTNFYEIGIKRGFDIVFWNNTPFELSELGFKEIKIHNAKTHPLTDFLKNAQIKIELSQNIKKSKDQVYNAYLFPQTHKNFKSIIKKKIIDLLFFLNNSKKGLQKIKKNITLQERKTKLYFDSLAALEKEKPSVVFCTNQRSAVAIASILAAKDLGIPTVAFIFSWDNLPKGTKIIDTDFYIVWSEHMKMELKYYYPNINDEQIFITGTPQFESHFNKTILQSKDYFFKENKLDNAKKYICFSGDDITTSPNDPVYLADTASAIRVLNKKGYNLGIIFRRCPVDFSNRFDEVLEEFKDIIISIKPAWNRIGEDWNTIMSTKEDLVLQTNTIFHTESVINLGSSMVFDYVAHRKPCGFINYDVVNAQYPHWSVKKIYSLIHFRSMPTENPVFWINSPNEIANTIEKMLSKDSEKVIENAQLWFEKINQHSPEFASERIWEAISKIVKTTDKDL